MNILITGANGFVGHYLTGQLLQQHYSVIATGKGECRLPFTNHPGFTYISMDFTDPYEVHDVFEKVKPAVVIHAGAMGKPDECEQNQMQAHIVNVEGTLNLLYNAEEQHSFFIFLSTDFVFDGVNGNYTEQDNRNPVNYYGQTKMDAEDAVMEYNGQWAIVRTVLVYGKPLSGRSNILTIVKDKLEKNETYKVVNDQLRTPTYVEDLAGAIVSIIKKNASGTWHIAGGDWLTPYQVACQAADYLQLNKDLLIKVTEADFTQPAKRPAKTGFNISKAKKELGYSPISFAEGLIKTFN